MRFLALALLAVTPLVASAQGGKLLANRHGDVAFQRAGIGARNPLAQSAQVNLGDSDVAITGKQSLAAVTLPDSTQVLVGSETRVQLAFFNQAATTKAKFIVGRGRIRFEVHHPSGARADYTFQTPTSSLAVRGTEGDLEVDPSGTIRVNVYKLSNPDLPVSVTTANGKTYEIAAGHSLFAHVVNGVVQVEVGKLTQELVDRFSGDFGVPTNWAQLKQTLIQKAVQKLPPPPNLPVSIPFPPR
ncbi:MAG TPA: FecR family protein [Candidatus Dormibacteraeota bacterium]|nr:FecR family protein [Candidatus Dormibacteraeota bacterium]